VSERRAPTANRVTEQKNIRERSAANFEHKLNEQRGERKRGGRPIGAKNKPKGLMPKDFANEFLGVIKDILPAEYYQEMKDAVRTGKNISTATEAKITLKLMGPAIWRRLIDEGKVSEDGEPKEFARDLTERLKVYMSLMGFIEKVDDAPEGHNTQKPIFEVFAKRGTDGGRLKVLVGYESGSVGGSADGVGGASDSVGAIPDTVSERHVYISDSEQVEADRVLNDTVD
jgi:hypothetical protein